MCWVQRMLKQPARAVICLCIVTTASRRVWRSNGDCEGKFQHSLRARLYRYLVQGLRWPELIAREQQEWGCFLREGEQEVKGGHNTSQATTSPTGCSPIAPEADE